MVGFEDLVLRDLKLRRKLIMRSFGVRVQEGVKRREERNWRAQKIETN